MISEFELRRLRDAAFEYLPELQKEMEANATLREVDEYYSYLYTKLMILKKPRLTHIELAAVNLLYLVSELGFLYLDDPQIQDSYIPMIADNVRILSDVTGKPIPFARAKKQDISESERDKLLKHIGVLALLLAQSRGRYQKGEKSPNINGIVTAAQEIIELADFPGKEGTAKTELGKSIKAGLELLQDDD